MSYRNDHDAALNRIAALEQELADAHEQSRVQAARDDGKIAMLEREIDALKRHEPGRKQPPVVPKIAAAVDEIDQPPLVTRGPAISRTMLGLMMVLGVVIAALVTTVLGKHDFEPQRCTVRANTRAQVFGFADGTEYDLGMTPVELTREHWSRYGRLELRAGGYDTLTIPPPTIPCPPDAWELVRRD